MKIDSKEIEALISCSGEKRYTYFVKKIVDSETVWGLYNEGWALAATEEGVSVFPVWPAKEYAELSANGLWDRFKPKLISLEEFLNELLPNLEKDGLIPGVFYTPEDNGVIPSIEKLVDDIGTELEKY